MLYLIVLSSNLYTARSRCFLKFTFLQIFQLLPQKIQVGGFSADRLPPEALETIKKFMHMPLRILVNGDELLLEGIKQYYLNVDREQRKITQGVIMVSTRCKADWLTDKL